VRISRGGRDRNARLAQLREAMPLSKVIAGIGVRCEPQGGGGD